MNNNNPFPVVLGPLESNHEALNRDTLMKASIAEAANRNKRAGETISQILATAAQTYAVTQDVKPVWANPSISVKDFNAAKAKWLQPKDFTLLVLGDSKKVKDQLIKALGKVTDVKILPETTDWDGITQAVAPKF